MVRVLPCAVAGAVLALSLSASGVLAQLPESAAGASVFVIDSAEIAASNARSLSELLAARVPGVSVMRGGGSTADGASLRMRGVHSFAMSSTPLVVVDGVRVSSRQAMSAIGSSVQPSEIDELLPEDIARIEVLRGPAAAASYGPGAADGVIVVTTKSGVPGAFTTRARATAGLAFVPDRWPSNYHMNGISAATGQPIPWCGVIAVAAGSCKPTTLDRFNPLEQASPFRAERTAQAHISTSGGHGGTAGYLGATGAGTEGVLSGDALHRIGARAHVTQQLTPQLSLDASGAVLHDATSIPNLGATIGAGLFGGARNDSTHGYLPSTGLRARPEQQTADRATGSLALRWRPAAWLDAAAVAGHDRVSGREAILLPYLVYPQLVDTAFGGHRGVLHDDVRTLGASVAARYALRGHLRARTSLAWDRYTYAFSSRDSLGFAGSLTLLTLERRFHASGLSVAQQFVWHDRVTLDAALWRGGPWWSGGELQTEVYPSASAVWSVGQLGPTTDLRLRAAYGEASGLDPDYPGTALTSGLSILNGSSSRAERTREVEAGSDISFGNRVELSLTAFRADSRNLLVPNTSAYGGTMASPAGSLRNSGIELSAHARLLDRGPLQWMVTATVATLRDRVISIGNAQRLVSVITGVSPYQTWVSAPGHPVANWWAVPYTYADANRDGMIDSTEVHLANAATYVGAMGPAVEGSLRSSLGLASGLSAALALDYRGGYRLLNANEAMRCLYLNVNCRGSQDPTAPLGEQAAASALEKDYRAAAYYQDASFLRLRELSIGWELPARWARFTGGTTRVSLVGLDLLTLTPYKGVDPEITGGGPTNLPRFDLEKLPILPTVLLRVDLGGRSGT